MSAYIVSERHILTLAFHYHNMVLGTITNDQYDPEQLKETAKILWGENSKSVNYRYNVKGRVVFSRKNLAVPKINCSLTELYKLIRCWEYQTCEHPTHEKSIAWQMMQALKARMLDHIIVHTNTFEDSYEEAEWGI